MDPGVVQGQGRAVPPDGLRGLSWPRDFARKSDHGVVGYPASADAEQGRRMLDAAVAAVAAVARRVLDLPLPGA